MLFADHPILFFLQLMALVIVGLAALYAVAMAIFHAYFTLKLQHTFRVYMMKKSFEANPVYVQQLIKPFTMEKEANGK